MAGAHMGRTPHGSSSTPTRQAFPARGRSLRAHASASSTTELYYFAYGSNLNSTVLTGRRGVRPARVTPCVLKDYELSFTVPGLPYLEPAFATVAEAPGREVHGLACAVTPQQWERIQITETGYDVVEVLCDTYGEGEGDAPLLARTLVFPAQRRRRGLRPSKRYVDLIREGALEWNLDASWQRRLAEEHFFEPFSTAEQRMGALVTLGAVLPVTLTAGVSQAMTMGGDAAERISVQRRGERVFDAMTDFSWGLHDGLWQSVLGDGGSTTKLPS